MAKARINVLSVFRPKGGRKRPNVHAKTKNSVNKTGKYYKKKYRGQGR